MKPRRLCSISVVLLSILLSLLITNTAFAQDSSGVRTISRTYTIGWSSANSIAASDNITYIADGANGLRVFDVSNTNDVFEIGRCSLQGNAIDVVLRNGYAYVVCGPTGLHIVNVSNPSNPVEVGSCDTPGNAIEVCIQGDYAYVADSDSGLRIINIANPASPQATGFFVAQSAVRGVAISGTHAYITAGTFGLRILDITNPALPVEVGSIIPESLDKIAVSGNYAYVTGTWSSYFRVIDISNPMNPQQAGVCNYGGMYVFGIISGDLTISGNLAFTGGYYRWTLHGLSGEGYELMAINISNPANPSFISGTGIDDYPTGIAVTPNHVFASYRGEVYVSTLSPSPTLGEMRLFGTVPSFDRHANALPYVYNFSERLLSILDICDPVEPTFTDYCLQTNGWGVIGDIVRRDNYLYTTITTDNGLYYSTEFRVYDISVRTNPIECGMIQFPANTFPPRNPKWISLNDNYAFVTMDSTIQIIDVTSMDSLRSVGSYPITGVNCFAVTDSFVYLAVDSSFFVLNVTDPANPQQIGRCNIPWNAFTIVSDIKIIGNFAYLAHGDSGVRVIDVSNRSTPIDIACFNTPGHACKLAIAENQAIIADWNFGIRVLNISNPYNLTEVGYYNTPGSALDVSVENDTIYISDGNNFGIYTTSPVGIVIRTNDAIPEYCTLKPNYPNPFNATTEIRYSIAKASKVDLRLYDVAGREVAKLIDFNQNPGEYTFHFDGKPLASGTYFVHLKTGDYRQTQKIVLMR